MIRLRAMRRGGGEGARERYDRLLEGIRRGAARWLVADRDIGLAEVVGELLRERGATLATAESCTGGMIGEKLTEIPGSSDYYLGGVVAYANSAKSGLLGVPESLIREHGAVSGEVAEAMAEGARRGLGSDYGVAVTGIAGPGGGSPEKPVGTLWVAVATPRGTTARRHQLGNERAVVRERGTNIALEMVRRALTEGE
jgi:nicotinamide-nucleotide amidase